MALKKVKVLNTEEMTLFSIPFAKEGVTEVRHDEAVKVLTNSLGFKEKVQRVDCASHSIYSSVLGMYEGLPLKRGMVVYRYDDKDKLKGFPINKDLYVLDDWTLYKVEPSFEGHWLNSVPK